MQINPIYVIELPTTAIMPEQIDEGPIKSKAPQEFSPFYSPPATSAERLALSIWINTHQALFLTTAVASFTAGEALAAIVKGVIPEAVLPWLAWTREIRLSSAAYTSLPSLSREVYESYVRPSMVSVRAEFSGVSSSEATRFEQALHDLKTSLPAYQAMLPATQATQMKRAFSEVTTADRIWWQYHSAAMQRMVTIPVSLAKLQYRRLVETKEFQADFGSFKRAKLRDPAAVRDYDCYFAVRRAEVSLPEFRKTLERALEMSRPYVEQDGPLASFRHSGELAMRQVIEAVMERGLRASCAPTS